MIYEVTLRRVTERETVYTVEADSEEEAEELVLAGEYEEIVSDSEEGDMEDPEVVNVVEHFTI